MRIEHKPNFLGLSRIPRRTKNYPFLRLRERCSDVGLVLERISTGYNLSGNGLPSSGIDCQTQDDVEDELMNYE